MPLGGMKGTPRKTSQRRHLSWALKNELKAKKGIPNSSLSPQDPPQTAKQELERRIALGAREKPPGGMGLLFGAG